MTASRKAYAALYGMVQEHAAMLAFVEAFWLMGVVFLLMIPFLPLLQYTKPKRMVEVKAEVTHPDIPEGWLDDLAHEPEQDLVTH